MGYLIGFLISVFISGYFKFSAWSNLKSYMLTFGKLLIAVSPIYIFGNDVVIKFCRLGKSFFSGCETVSFG